MFEAYSFQASSAFLQQIGEAFGGSRDNPFMDPITIGIVVLLGIVIIAFLIFNKILRIGDDKFTATLNRKDILNILDQATEHRSRLDVSFHPITTSRQTITCAVLEVQPEGILLELPVGVNPSANWIDRIMACFFRIPRPDGHPYFYKFISPVHEVKEISGVHYLVLKVPDKIELGQKRKHLRLEIPPMDILDFRIWPASEDSTFHYENDPEKWPEPLAVFSRESGNHLRIMDISGGGIRMMFDPKEYGSLDEFVAEHPILFMRLELAAALTRSQVMYFVAARLRTKMKDFDTGVLMLGYEFVECSEPKDETFDWIKIKPEEGIDELVTWIFKRHLELYRERSSI